MMKSTARRPHPDGGILSKTLATRHGQRGETKKVFTHKTKAYCIYSSLLSIYFVHCSAMARAIPRNVRDRSCAVFPCLQ